MIRILAAIALLAFAAVAPGADWVPLFDGKTLNGWEPVGECKWMVTGEGYLFGRRPVANGKEPFGPWPVAQKTYRAWFNDQAWIYTTRNDFTSYDLHLEFWLQEGGNSGVSLYDSSRGSSSFGPAKIVTPAHIGYEIQIMGTDEGEYITGAIYTLQRAKTGLQKFNSWNMLDIETRPDMIRVKVNGQVAAEHAPDPARPKTGPIGLQLHDRSTWVMFRNIKIREVK